jgi:hypothetical protein
MLIKIDGRTVDVLDEKCAKRPCFWLGFNKGTFVQGRGYTKYHAKERPVCWQRHMSGCPTHTVCDECNTAYVDAAICPNCKRQTRAKEKADDK